MITDISAIHTNVKTNGSSNKNGNVILLTPVWAGLGKALLKYANTHTNQFLLCLITLWRYTITAAS